MNELMSMQSLRKTTIEWSNKKASRQQRLEHERTQLKEASRVSELVNIIDKSPRTKHITPVPSDPNLYVESSSEASEINSKTGSTRAADNMMSTLVSRRTSR
jgi:hypothetical protein